MATMNISLPDPMKAWVDAQATDGRDAGDFVRDLIEREHEQRIKIAAMQVLIDEARAGGISERRMDDIWQGARQRAGVAG